MNAQNDNSKLQYETLDEEINFTDILRDVSALDSAQQLQLFKSQPPTIEAMSETSSPEVEREIPIFVPCPAKYNRPVWQSALKKWDLFSRGSRFGIKLERECVLTAIPPRMCLISFIRIFSFLKRRKYH